MWSVGVITIMPEMFEALRHGVIGRAFEANLATLHTWNPRDFALPPRFSVDDKPYGGGPGMVMMYEPLHQAIQTAKQALPAETKTVYLSPQGRTVKQSLLAKMVETKTPLLFIAGRYEGIDERIIEHHIDEEWSLGDFVLSGGELAAMVCIDAMVRLLPGSLGDPTSAVRDSFTSGLLDHPHYTRPACIHDHKVPDVLLSGHHRKIERFRRKETLGKTWLKRPDLLRNVSLSQLDEQLLVEFKQEQR